MYKVSILVPVFNVEQYLEECLNSILAQSLSDIEIICINDGSTDASSRILQQYASEDNRIHVINQDNLGYGHAINVGFQSASGEYVGIVEPDDYIENNMYELLWNTARKYHLDFVKGDYSYFKGPPNDRRYDRIMICPRLWWYKRLLHPSRTPSLLDVDMMNVTGIYRKSFLEEKKISLLETPGASYQDTGMWFQIFTQAETCMFLPYSFYYIRRDNPNSSVLNPGKFGAISYEYEMLTQKLKQNPDAFLLFASHLFKRKMFAYLFFLSKSDVAAQTHLLPVVSSEIKAARQSGDYDEPLFEPSMNNFLKQVEDWKAGDEIPTYVSSGSWWNRLGECVQEHGIIYTIRRLLIKLKIREEIF